MPVIAGIHIAAWESPNRTTVVAEETSPKLQSRSAVSSLRVAQPPFMTPPLSRCACSRVGSRSLGSGPARTGSGSGGRAAVTGPRVGRGASLPEAEVRSPDAASDVMATAAEQATARTSVRRLPRDGPRMRKRPSTYRVLSAATPMASRARDTRTGRPSGRPERPRGSGSASARDRVSRRSGQTIAADPSRADEPATRPGDRRR